MARDQAMVVRSQDFATQLIGQLDKNQDMIKLALPQGISFDALKGRLQVQLRRDQKLAECSPNSVFWAIVKSMALGLEIGDIYGEAYIIGYEKGRDNAGGMKVATLVPGYKGLEKLARQSPLVKNFAASLVYEYDVFDIDLGSANSVIFRPEMKRRDGRGEVVCGYFRLELMNGAVTHTPVSWDYLERIRKRARGKDNPASPWNTDREEMFKKTVIRYGLKDAPRSLELAQALSTANAEDENVELEDGDPILVEEPRQVSRTQQSTKRLQQQAQPAVAALPVGTASQVLGDDEYPPEPVVVQRQAPPPAQAAQAPAPAPAPQPAPMAAPVAAPPPAPAPEAPAPVRHRQVAAPPPPQYSPPAPAAQAAAAPPTGRRPLPTGFTYADPPPAAAAALPSTPIHQATPIQAPAPASVPPPPPPPAPVQASLPAIPSFTMPTGPAVFAEDLDDMPDSDESI